jgi:hypothetical protein
MQIGGMQIIVLQVKICRLLLSSRSRSGIEDHQVGWGEAVAFATPPTGRIVVPCANHLLGSGSLMIPDQQQPMVMPPASRLLILFSSPTSTTLLMTPCLA